MDLGDIAAEGRFDRQIELVREHWRAVRHLWLEETDVGAGLRNVRSNLPDNFVLGCGMPGVASVRPTRDGRFEFSEDALTAFIIPAYTTIPGNLDANPATHVEHLVDLVAVDVGDPDRFRRRRGDAVVLGNAYLEIADETCAPVPVFRNPMSWLRAAGAGICILDWDYARDLLLDHELIGEDLELGDRLEAALAPDIWIRGAA